MNVSFLFAVLLALFTTAFAKHEYSQDLLHLAEMSQGELDEIYGQCTSGSIPDGKTFGLAQFFPSDTEANEVIMNMAEFIWEGKTFSKVNETYATLVNRIFHMPFVHANVYFGESWYDGKEAIIFDYSQRNNDAFGLIRDEVREFAPNKWLGRVYLFTSNKPFVINFALEL